MRRAHTVGEGKGHSSSSCFFCSYSGCSSSCTGRSGHWLLLPTPLCRDYWRARRLTLDDGIALIGIHVLMEGKGCVKVGGNTTVAAGGEEDAAAAAAAEVTASGAVSPAHT